MNNWPRCWGWGAAIPAGLFRSSKRKDFWRPAVARSSSAIAKRSNGEPASAMKLSKTILRKFCAGFTRQENSKTAKASRFFAQDRLTKLQIYVFRMVLDLAFDREDSRPCSIECQVDRFSALSSGD